MLRKLTGAALAVAVGGGVYVAATPADASNMGFKLERSFRLERYDGDPTGKTFQNQYFVSFPLFNGLDPNLANSGDASSNKCVGDAGPPAGPAAGDNFLNADDALCDLWTDKTGSMQLVHFIPSNCTTENRTATKTGFNTIQFAGPWDSYWDDDANGATPRVPDPKQALDTDKALNPAALDDYRAVAYKVFVADAGSRTSTPANTAVIVGSHDPNYAGRNITYNTACGSGAARLEYLNVPYHTMLRAADEVLCGLPRSLDPTNGWVDLVNNSSGAALPDSDGDTIADNPDGPDTCPNGIFDWRGGPPSGGGTLPTGYSIQIRTFDNVDDGSGPIGSDTDDTAIIRTLTFNTFSKLVFSPPGANFTLTPGDGYQVTLTSQHTTTLWKSPHF